MSWIQTADGKIFRADLLESVDIDKEQGDLLRASPMKAQGGPGSRVIVIYGFFRVQPTVLEKHPLGRGFRSHEIAVEATHAFLKAVALRETSVHKFPIPAQ